MLKAQPNNKDNGMQLSKKQLGLMLFATVLATCLLTTVTVIAVTPTTTFSIYGGNYPGAPSYTVFSDGSGNYFAKNHLGMIVYSGIDFAITTNLAIQAAGVSGSIYITPSASNYYYSSSILIDQEGFTLYGALGTVLMQTAGANAESAIEVTASAVTIHGLFIDGNYNENTGSTIGIYLSSASADYFTLHHCHIQHFDGTLIALTNNNNIFDIHDNFAAESSTGNALFISGGADGFIHHNQFGGCATAAQGIVRVSTCAYVEFTNNKVFGTSTYYLYLDSPVNSKFDGNIIGGGLPYPSSAQMIYLTSYAANYGFGNSISNNRIYGGITTGDAIRMVGSSIMNNTVNGNLFSDLVAGIVEYGGTPDYNLATGNLFKNVTYPISFSGANSIAIANAGSGVADYP